jgi:hypothetical protein
MKSFPKYICANIFISLLIVITLVNESTIAAQIHNSNSGKVFPLNPFGAFDMSVKVYGGNKTISIYSSPFDYGTVDLCGKTESNAVNCFDSNTGEANRDGTYVWSTNMYGNATVTIFVPSDFYKCFDSLATSQITGAWNYNQDFVSPSINHSKEDWRAPPIDFNIGICK